MCKHAQNGMPGPEFDFRMVEGRVATVASLLASLDWKIRSWLDRAVSCDRQASHRIARDVRCSRLAWVQAAAHHLDRLGHDLVDKKSHVDGRAKAALDSEEVERTRAHQAHDRNNVLVPTLPLWSLAARSSLDAYIPVQL